MNALTISTDKDQRPKTMEKYVAFRTAEKNMSTEKAIKMMKIELQTLR